MDEASGAVGRVDGREARPQALTSAEQGNSAEFQRNTSLGQNLRWLRELPSWPHGPAAVAVLSLAWSVHPGQAVGPHPDLGEGSQVSIRGGER